MHLTTFQQLHCILLPLVSLLSRITLVVVATKLPPLYFLLLFFVPGIANYKLRRHCIVSTRFNEVLIEVTPLDHLSFIGKRTLRFRHTSDEGLFLFFDKDGPSDNDV
jgi:hypothetical protein